MTGVSIQPVAEVGAARRRRLRLGAARAHAFAECRAFAQPVAHDLDRDQLDRLVGAGAVAVGLLVLAAERLLQMRDTSIGPSGTGTVSS